MKFSTKSRYGLRLMVELAINYASAEPVPLSDIAQRQDLSEGYLEQLITALRKGELVRSVRGAHGGYLLAREPQAITAGDVIRALEGPLGPTDCVREDCPEPCHRADICVTKDLWERVKDAIVDVLDATTLEDLRLEAERITKEHEPIVYYI
ncbi:MAG: RrF2 family transcriptional regulator [Methylocystaceae bacterium]